MLWRGRRESSNVVDQRKFGAGSLSIGGLILGAVVYYFMGGNPVDYIAQNAGSVSSRSAMSESASERDEERKSFVSVVLADTEDVWSKQFQGSSQSYVAPKLILFRGAVRSACGSASAATGPFYCPADQRVYLDMSFFDELSTALGASGDTAAAYVIAHEVGHHVQNLLGLMQPRKLSNSESVSVELQADCLAGIWAAHVEKEKYIEPGDIDEAMKAAEAVGDDRLQSRAGREVVPDSFTHGSSAQRAAAFKRGYSSGALSSCM